jgi:CheY-like chemotaxis protein
MSREVLEKVFEPFFTTKEVGKGSGLGLPMVYGFAKQSGGHVAIASEPKKGTVVTLYLPEAAAGSQVAAAARTDVASSPRGAERILLVEDEPEVRRFVSRQLTGLGYAVVEAGDGKTALSILNSDKGIDLLFSDIVLPGGMSGFQLLRQARDMRPELRAVLTTGFAQDFGAAGTEIVDPILRKPYKRQELAETLREALTRQAA